MKTYDAIVIGTGQAGPTLTSRLAMAGHKTAVIERGAFGGTCVNVGCIPTKTLVASARVAYVVRRAADYGIHVPGPLSVDMPEVMARKNAIVEKSTQGLEKWLKDMDHVDVYQGHARFQGPRTVVVGDETLQADRIFINVGTRPFIPDLPGIGEVPLLTNEEMLQLNVVPDHLIVVGGSYIGLEFGQMFHRFGSKVTIIEKSSHLVSREDRDVSDAIRGFLEDEGLNVRTNADCIGVAADPQGVKVVLDCGEDPREVTGSHLLLAVGRVPNTDDLGLERTGIGVDKRGYISVNDELETDVAGVWALGDVNGQGAFTHTAYNDHEIVADNLLHDGKRRLSDRIPAYALFVDPPLGRIGMTEAQVRASGRPALIGKRAMTRVGRAVERGETAGFMKVLIDAETEQILGASILGIGGDEVVHSLLDVMYTKAPYTVIQQAVHIHPTVTELIPTMLGELKPLDG